eukprot:gene13243-17749_t
MDPKVKNLIKFLLVRIGSISAVIAAVYYSLDETNRWLVLLAYVTLSIVVWRSLLSIYRRLILPAKRPLQYGRWAIVTGSTSGIGKEFAETLAKQGMSLLIISRTESKLVEQVEEILKFAKVQMKYLAYDFSKLGNEKTEFYQKLEKLLQEMDENGGIGLLVNNIGTANTYPKNIDECDDTEVEEMISCNIYSTIWMTRAVLKFMKIKKNGCIISISSGSGNHPGPFLTIYSATKAFITQFSRSMSVECWGTGVDFYVVTPFYVVSNLYKRRSGTIIAPMPIKLVEGTLSQLGKKFVWQ